MSFITAHETDPNAVTKSVEIQMTKEDQGFGFVMRGGLNPNDSKTRPLTVTQIRAGGPADR